MCAEVKLTALAQMPATLCSGLGSLTGLELTDSAGLPSDEPQDCPFSIPQH